VVDVPKGFSRNDGHVELSCPTSTGQFVTPMWVRRLGSGEVEMRAGREGEEATYVAELYLDPDYSQEPTEATPRWFLDLLHGADGGFHTLARAAHKLPNWAAYAEVIRYQREETVLRHLQHDHEELSIRLEASRARLSDCRYRMEAWELPSQLRNLEGRVDVRHTSGRAPQIARRGCGVPVCLSNRQARLPSAGASG
jgi:hypothetical protein